MTEEQAWERANWQAHRLAQQREFLALPFTEKLRRLEQLAEVAAMLRAATRHERTSQPPDDNGG